MNHNCTWSGKVKRRKEAFLLGDGLAEEEISKKEILDGKGTYLTGKNKMHTI